MGQQAVPKPAEIVSRVGNRNQPISSGFPAVPKPAETPAADF